MHEAYLKRLCAVACLDSYFSWCKQTKVATQVVTDVYNNILAFLL